MVESLATTPASGSGSLDPITLEILWSRLVSIIEEAESTLVRTSFSPIVGEADDHSAARFHHVSLEWRLGLGTNDAEINAVKR